MNVFDTISRNGPWSAAQIRAFIQDRRIPLRFACITTTNYPLVTSLWYLWQEDAFWCAVQQDSRVAQYCRRTPRCGYEVAADSPPYQGVRGTADVTIVPAVGPDILRQLILRYLQSDESKLARWLLSRSATEVALRIAPRHAYSWDYSQRMSEAN